MTVQRFVLDVRARLAWVAAGAMLVVAAASPAAFAGLPQQSGAVDLLAQANVELDGTAAGDHAGDAVAPAGDVNGDGLSDVIVGAPAASNSGQAGSGSAYVVFGRVSPGPVDLAALGSSGFRIDGAAAGDEAGTAVAGAGDVNRDGLADVIVGAPRADPFVSGVTRSDAGAAYVVFGRAGSQPVSLGALGAGGLRLVGGQAGGQAGTSVAGTGDSNGDGRPDVVIGAPNPSGKGSAYVVFGRVPTPNQEVTGTTPVLDLGALGAGGYPIVGVFGSYTGASVAGGGDVNGDGRPDVIVGVPYLTGFTSVKPPGGAYVVFGKSDVGGVDLTALGSAGFGITGAPDDLAGRAVAGAGDVNGDGLADLVVGAPFADPGARDAAGAAYVVFGRTTTTTVTLSLLTRGYVVAGAAAGDFAGWSVAGTGDVNGDGRPDILVGAPGASSRGQATGAAYVSYGVSSPTTVDLGDLGGAGYLAQGAEAGSATGRAVAAAGDVNGDGRPDLIVGAPYAGANARASSGSAYLLYGFGPAALSYAGGITAVAGSAITPLTPTVARTGTNAFAVSPALPPGLSLDPQTGVISGTPAQARAAAAYTVTMSDLSGSAQTTVTVAVSGPGTTPPGTTPPGTPDVSPPTIAGFAFTPSRFRPAAGTTALSARTARGSTIAFTLSEHASVRITLTRILGSGRTSGRRCVKPTAKLRRSARCTRTRTVAVLTRGDQPAGANRLPFSGRVSARPLPAARYRATVTATDRAGNTSRPSTAAFTIARR